MPSHFCTLHPLPTWCSRSTPPPNTSINWQWISRVKMLCLHKVYHSTKCSAWQSLHWHYNCM
jgi:hypothetical protein